MRRARPIRQVNQGGTTARETLARVRRVLSQRRDVVERRMVGGQSFLANGHMCCGLARGGLLVRVGPDARASALELPHVRPMLFAGRPLSGFVCVDPAGYRTDAALKHWVQRALSYVSTLAAKTGGERGDRIGRARRRTAGRLRRRGRRSA